MPTFRLTEGDLHYLELGAGPTLVLLHGWPVSSVYWREDAQALASHFRVLAVDLPGFGRSFEPREAGCSIGIQARRMAEFIRGVAGGPVSLAGHSMGGMIAARLAATQPELVERMILLAAPLEGTTALSFLGMMGRFAPIRWFVTGALRLAPIRSAVAPWFAHAIRVPDEVMHAAGIGSSIAIRTALESLTHDCTRAHLQAIRCPTLFIAADRDLVVHPLQALLAKGWISGCRLEVFRDCGHCPNLEYPGLFRDLVREFLG